MSTDIRPIKNYILPAKHVRIRQVRANETYLLASRGSFKTTRGIALFVHDMIYSMPRSSGMICGLSFEDMDNNTINPLLGGLSELGMEEGVHYVYGRKPPEQWDRPFLGVINGKYKRVISFHNGTVIYIVSMEKKAPANGLSVQWGVFDEVKFMEERKLIDKIFPTFRGNEKCLTPEGKTFDSLSCYLSKFFATDKEADPAQIKWLLDKRKLCDKQLEEIIVSFQQQLDQRIAEKNTEGLGQAKKAALQREIDGLTAVLNEERTGLVSVAEINIEDVRPLLSDAWYKDKKRNSTPRLWRVVYLNEDPETAGDTFYPYFDKTRHCYESLTDINPARGFIFTADYQHSVTPITLAQLSTLPGSDTPSLNYVDEIYTLPDPNDADIADNGNGSKGSLSEAVQLFCDRYKKHPRKRVYYVFDQTAKGKRINADEYYKIVLAVLKKNRWNVVKVYIGRMSDHYSRYTNTSDWLKHDDASLPPVFINSLRCRKLITSISNSAAKVANGKTEKNKEYENTTRYPSLDQSGTTHFSDTFDMCNHAVLHLRKLRPTNTKTGSLIKQ